MFLGREHIKLPEIDISRHRGHRLAYSASRELKEEIEAQERNVGLGWLDMPMHGKRLPAVTTVDTVSTCVGHSNKKVSTHL